MVNVKQLLIISSVLLILLSSPTISLSEDFYLGSYNSIIKVSPDLDSDEDWDSTIQALQDSGHNFYGYPAWDGVSYDDETGFYWKNFLELLEESKGTGINIFAVVPESHQIYGSAVNRWGVGADHNREEWYAAHLRAAEEFSLLATKYPHFIGWSIDDFSGKICNPEYIIRGKGCYNLEQVREITRQSKVKDPDFEFWPTNYFREFYTFMDSYALGSTYGVKMFDDEYAKVDLTFNLDPLPTEADFSFLYYDTVKDADEAATLYSEKFKHDFIINGHTIWEKNIANDNYVESYNQNIVSYLTTGENVITFRFYQDRGSPSNGYYYKMLYISKPKLILDGSDVSYSDSFDYYANPTLYSFKDEMKSNDGSKDGIEKIVATEISENNIAPYVDGALIPHYAGSKFYTPERFNFLLETTESFLPDGFRNLLVLYGMLLGKDISSIDLEEQIILASEITDGVLIWNNPLVLNYENKGVLSQRDELGDEMIFYWPGYRQGMEGYFQEWETKDSYSKYTIDIYDDDDSNTKDYFYKEIKLEDGTLIYNDSVNESEGIEVIPITLSRPQKLKIKIYENLGVGNYFLQVRFKVNTGDGYLNSEDFNFNSGTAKIELESIYPAISSAFNTIASGSTLITGSEICTDGLDNDGDGSLDCFDDDCDLDCTEFLTSNLGSYYGACDLLDSLSIFDFNDDGCLTFSDIISFMNILVG